MFVRMQGHVYQIAASRHGNQPHLNVVVLEFSGNQDCIVVPAFSADGHAVNEVIQGWLDQGYRIDQIAVTMDNASHIQFVTRHTGKLAHWLVSDPDRLPLAEVRTYTFLGTMDEAGLKAIATGLLNFASSHVRFSAAVLKRLRQLAER
jgi:hypothetical protein